MGHSKPTRRGRAGEPALAYLRVSGRGQIDGDGFPRQREAVACYARTHGVEVVGEYRDEGVSGTRDLDDREGLSELIEHIRTNGVRLVLIERADRLARDLVVSEMILGQFRQLGVRVVAADSDADLTVADEDPTRVLIRQVLGAVSQFEKSVIVAKLRAARRRKRRATGRCEGRKAFGVHPGEDRILARMIQLRRKPRNRQRLSYGAIAAQLNAEGVSTRTGSPWRPGTVRRILNRAQVKRASKSTAAS